MIGYLILNSWVTLLLKTDIVNDYTRFSSKTKEIQSYFVKTTMVPGYAGMPPYLQYRMPGMVVIK
jgi:hypothetical protein